MKELDPREHKHDGELKAKGEYGKLDPHDELDENTDSNRETAGRRDRNAQKSHIFNRVHEVAVETGPESSLPRSNMRGVVYCKHEGEWAGRAGTKYLPSIIVDTKPESTERMMKLSNIAINKAIASNRTTRRDEKSSGCRKHSIFGEAALPNLFIKIS